MNSITTSTPNQLLAIDNSPSNLAILDACLNTGNFSLKAATMGQKAIEILEEDPGFDLILLNNNLADMSGVDVLQMIKKNPEISHIPVLMIIDCFDLKETKPLREKGADDFITMPLNCNELNHRITILLTIKSQATQIKDYNTRLEQQIAVRKKLFSTISHDLRTPFGAMEVLMELLSSSIENNNISQTREYLQMMESTIEAGHKLFENLIQWGRSQTGRLKVDPMELQVAAVAEEIIDLMWPDAKDKNIELTNKIKDDVVVFADAQILKIILKNLIFNGIKYCEPQKGTIILSSKKHGDTIYLSIQDNGIGIDNDIINRLFIPDCNFTSRHGTRGEEGTGLGLIICNEFARKMGGKITVNSKPGQGSTFTLQIPAIEIASLSSQNTQTLPDTEGR